MLQADKITLSLDILVPAGTATIVDGMSLDDLAAAVLAAGGTCCPVSVVGSTTVESDEAAIEVASSGADLAPFVGEGHGSVRVVRPMQVAHPAGHFDTAPVLRALPVPGGWRGTWRFGHGDVTELLDIHPNGDDAIEDARRHAAASRDPEAEADEFEGIVSTDPFDATIHYASLFIDDENRWRGRWYREEWSSEGQYTERLYDTPGQARRAAKRLRDTGDES